MTFLENLLITAVTCAGIALLAAPTAGSQEYAAPATTAAPAASTAAPVAELHYSNKWRLRGERRREQRRRHGFRIAPKGGAEIDIRVELKDGRGEDGWLATCAIPSRKTLAKDIYKVGVDDGEDVLVKVRKGPDVAIGLVESTVKGTRVNLDRE